MVRIRLRRVGSKGQPSYRIVIADSRSPRNGRFIEKIGFYNPRTNPPTMTLDEERALHWLSQGAQPSEAVERILKKLGTRDRYARLGAGESLEALLTEAEQAAAARPPVDPRTRHDAVPGQSKKKVKAEVTAEVIAEAETLEEEEEAKAASETEAETPEAEAEAASEAEAETPEEEAEAAPEAEAETPEEEAEAAESEAEG